MLYPLGYINWKQFQFSGFTPLVREIMSEDEARVEDAYDNLCAANLEEYPELGQEVIPILLDLLARETIRNRCGILSVLMPIANYAYSRLKDDPTGDHVTDNQILALIDTGYDLYCPFLMCPENAFAAALLLASLPHHARQSLPMLKEAYEARSAPHHMLHAVRTLAEESEALSSDERTEYTTFLTEVLFAEKDELARLEAAVGVIHLMKEQTPPRVDAYFVQRLAAANHEFEASYLSFPTIYLQDLAVYLGCERAIRILIKALDLIRDMFYTMVITEEVLALALRNNVKMQYSGTHSSEIGGIEVHWYCTPSSPRFQAAQLTEIQREVLYAIIRNPILQGGKIRTNLFEIQGLPNTPKELEALLGA